MKATSGTSDQEKGILAKNTLINIAGQVIPLLFAVVAIPFIIDGLNTDRFGVLTIVWILIGYFGLFDMGVGRATTKFVADQQAKDSDQLSPIILTSLLLLIGFGIIGGLLIAAVTPYIVNNILNIPAKLISETQKAFWVISASIPLVLGSVGARGVLEAQQRFALVNTVNIPASVINYVGPLLILPFSRQLHHVVLLLVAGRVVSFIIYLYYSCRDQDFTGFAGYPFVEWTKRLLSYGAWLTVSNFISPIMVYMDRFILGAILTMTAVAYYTTPYEVVTRLGIIAGGFMGVMFPAFSVHSIKNNNKLVSLHQKSIRYLLLVFIPIVTFLIIAAEPLLYVWVGSDFAQNSSLVLQILAVGIVINSVARVPSTVIQAVGRPDIRAKLHMVELPIYLGLMWFLAYHFGIAGVAITWVTRVAIDAVFLFYFTNRIIGFMPKISPNLYTQILSYIGLLGLFGVICYFLEGRIGIFIFGIIAALSTLYINWTYMLRNDERKQIWQLYLSLKKLFTSKPMV